MRQPACTESSACSFVSRCVRRARSSSSDIRRDRGARVGTPLLTAAPRAVDAGRMFRGDRPIGGAIVCGWQDAEPQSSARSRCVPLPRVASGRLGDSQIGCDLQTNRSGSRALLAPFQKSARSKQAPCGLSRRGGVAIDRHDDELTLRATRLLCQRCVRHVSFARSSAPPADVESIGEIPVRRCGIATSSHVRLRRSREMHRPSCVAEIPKAQRQHRKHIVPAPERLSVNEPFESFDAQRELSRSQRPLA